MANDPVSTRLRYLSANIRRFREKHGWTQAQLAERVGVDPRYVQTLESGRANPTATTIIRVADALQTTPGGLFRKATLRKRAPGRPPRKGR